MSEAEPASVSPRTPGRRPSTSTAELADVLRAQRPVLIGVALVVSVVGAIIAAVAPTVLPPRPLAGAAVGFAACALAVAAAVALDAADRVVRGPRHVRGAGAVHVATVGARGVAPLVNWAEHRLRTEGSIRLAVAGAGVDLLRSGRLTDELARNLARRGWRVLRVDLHEPNGKDGVAEVVRGTRRLSEVVDYHPTLDLAEVGPGHDLDAALDGFPELATRLPRDVDALLVAMPGVRQSGVLPAIAAIDGILVLAQAGSTTRVELIAALDALDEARVPSEVVLLDEDARLDGAVVEPSAVDEPHDLAEPPTEPTAEPAANEEPEVEPEPEPEPVPAAPEPEMAVADDTAEIAPFDLDAHEEPEPEPADAPAAPEPPAPEPTVEDEPAEEPPPAPPPPAEPPKPDPLERTPYASDAWDRPGPDPGRREPSQRRAEPEDRGADVARSADHEREEALRLTATLEHLANEIWARESGIDQDSGPATT